MKYVWIVFVREHMIVGVFDNYKTAYEYCRNVDVPYRLVRFEVAS